MLRGERAAFRIAPELSFAQKECSLKPPKGMSAEADLVIDIQLVHWYRKGQVRAVGDDGVILRTTKGSESWEHPRPPFEVKIFLQAVHFLHLISYVIWSDLFVSTMVVSARHHT